MFWAMNWAIHSWNERVDKVLLVVGAYVAGTSLTGAPSKVTVFMRNTLFFLWFVLVTIKMSAFAALGIDLQLEASLMLLPVAAIGQVLGLKVNELILINDQLFKLVLGGVLIVIFLFALWDL
jgi:hypothetical protein